LPLDWRETPGYPCVTHDDEPALVNTR
jgi:hypothetical protein